jgi:hypothetical protein
MGLRGGVALRAAVLAAVLGFAAAGFISSQSHSRYGRAADLVPGFAVDVYTRCFLP